MQSRQVRHAAFAIQLGLGLLGVLTLPNCSAPEAADADSSHLGAITSNLEHCGGVACTGNSDCQSNVPVCATANSGVCLLTSPRECAWSLAISSSCPCLEHDVRLCTMSGGSGGSGGGGSSPGVQICTTNKAHTGTAWGACSPCPSCSP